MTKTKQILSKILCFALIIIIGGGMYLSAFSLIASAAETQGYSNVIDDLSKDENFKLSDYPDKPGDYSLDVIHVAEGASGEVYVYVYQPSNATKDLKAAKINMSVLDPTDRATRENKASYELYDLTWLNSYGTLDKYVINNFKKTNDAVRYYTIAAVYTMFDSSIHDEAMADDDIKDYVGLPVAKTFGVQYYNGELQTVCKQIDYVDIDIQSVGFTRYENGLWTNSSCDSHFVAFSVTNFNVDQVYDADVKYSYHSVHKTYDSFLGDTIVEGEPQEKVIFVSEADTGDNYNAQWFEYKYTWKRIVPVEQFVIEIEDHTNEFLTEEYAENLSNSEFVIRFLETDYKKSTQQGITTETYTSLTEVAILRLHFLADGKTYNLGAVSDIISDDGIPDFVVDAMDNLQNMFEETWEKILAILGLVLLITFLVFLGLNPALLLQLLWGVLKLCWAIIKLPFKLILFPFRKNKRE